MTWYETDADCKTCDGAGAVNPRRPVCTRAVEVEVRFLAAVLSGGTLFEQAVEAGDYEAQTRLYAQDALLQSSNWIDCA